MRETDEWPVNKSDTVSSNVLFFSFQSSRLGVGVDVQ